MTGGSAARSVRDRRARVDSDGSRMNGGGVCLNLGTVNLVVGNDE
jgi:hypothetical protein